MSGWWNTTATTWTCATRPPSPTWTRWSTGLVGHLGVGYLKLDYNIDPGAGTDLAADSVGAGLLGHNRAHLLWLDRVLDRHPDLILENCASGAMRMDYALLSRMQVQSTSDQQDYRLYPPIAVAAPMSVLPEQSASWAYPQPDMSDEQIAYTMCTGLLGRLYLSGRLDGMDEGQRDSVRAAVDVYKSIRSEVARAVAAVAVGSAGLDRSVAQPGSASRRDHLPCRVAAR